MTAGPDLPAGSASAQIQSVEQLVRTRLAQALGGGRGILEAAVPTATFTVTYLTTRDLRTSLIVSIGVTVLLLLVRIVQRSNPQFVLNALLGIAIAAIFAARSGEARDVFLPGILLNTGYAALCAVSVLVGWPIIGFLVGSITGDPTAWHTNRQVVRLCSVLTWIVVVPCALRAGVQYPLWRADEIALLGTVKIALGWPLHVAMFAAMAWVLGRNHTPLEDTRGL